MQGLKSVILTTVFLLALFVTASLYAYPSSYEWRTRETEHFRITYHQGEEELVERVSRMIEEIHDNLSPILENEGRFKTEVLLVDHVDSPNGFANVYPYNKLVLYAVPPGHDSVLNDYDDWLRVLISHEYTHVLQMDKTAGLVTAINLIMGKTYHPNQYMPRWYTEGSAIWSESKLTAGGRNRSSYFDMFLRANFLEGKDTLISDWNSSRDQWPRGNMVYLYGMKFMQYMADKTGDDTYAALAYLYGQRVVPYALNTVMEQVADTNWMDLYDEWHAQLKGAYLEDKRRLERLGLTKFEKITMGGEAHNSPILHPGGKRLVFYHYDADSQPTWVSLDLETHKMTPLVEAVSNGGASFAPDGRRLVYAQPQNYDRAYYYYDLFVHDSVSGETKQITKRRRAREPSWHPDGSQIAYVAYTTAKSHLEVIDLDRGRTHEPLPRQLFDQVLLPRYSPDGRYLAFIGWKTGGFKDLYLLDTQTNQLAALTDDHNQDLTPAWSPDGRYLFWSSDRTGIFNIYAHDMQTGSKHQVTNVLTGAFSPMITPDGQRLYFAHYSSDAFDLAYMDLHENPWLPVPEVPEMRPAKNYAMKPVESKDYEYSPFPSVYPKLWHPTWGEDAKGDTLGVRLWGNDISYQHSWEAEFDYGIESKTPTFGASYTTRAFRPNLSMRFTHTSYSIKEAALIDSKRLDQDESRYAGAVSMGLPLAGLDYKGDTVSPYSHGISLGYSFSYTRLLNQYDYEPLLRKPLFAETGLSSGFSLSWNYSNRKGYPGHIGTAAGRSFYVSVRTASKVFGSDYENLSAAAGYSEYIANPWIEDHVLALKFMGGIGISDYAERQIFYLGGPPDQDIVSDLIRNERIYGNYVRGYEPLSISGNKYLMFKTEYRFVLWRIEKGVYTLPIFFRRLHFAPFFDAANAWSDRLEVDDTRMGVGGEFRLDIVVGYAQSITLRVGYQVGLNEGGIHGFIMALDNLF